MNNSSHAVKKKISGGNSKEKGSCDYVTVLRTMLRIFLDKHIKCMDYYTIGFHTLSVLETC